MRKRLIEAFLPFFVFILIFTSCSKSVPSAILDADANPIADVSDTIELYDEAFSAYAKYATSEAVQILSEIYECGDDEALKMLQENGMKIYTAAIPIQISAANNVCTQMCSDAPLSIAVTDSQARLTMIYSSSGDITSVFAGSAIKPLSVYAPCIESGIMNWSSMQPDSPIKRLSKEAGGGLWPSNGNGIYTEKNVTAASALSQSLNTVAVRWLKEYGVENAMNFLEDSFGINLQRERSIYALTSEEEILANIALGYLQAGVNVCDMAGYYRIFNDKGNYTPAFSIEKIEDAEEKLIYTAKAEKKQVVSEETAWIMNRMLKGVIDNGTGKKANISGEYIVGKTGTTDDYSDNWFVGVMPQNTVAVWHGKKSSNIASEIFSAFVPEAKISSSGNFTQCESVVQKIFCPESGLLVSENCTEIEMGYYKLTDSISQCNSHQ